MSSLSRSPGAAYARLIIRYAVLVIPLLYVSGSRAHGRMTSSVRIRESIAWSNCSRSSLFDGVSVAASIASAFCRNARADATASVTAWRE